MNEKKLGTTPQQRKLPEWMSVQNETCPAVEGKVCDSPVILSDGKFSVNFTVKSIFTCKLRSPFKIELLLCDWLNFNGVYKMGILTLYFTFLSSLYG